MKRKEIIENNKLIAKFMGVDKKSAAWKMNLFGYARSWDKLVPVIQKIKDSISESETPPTQLDGMRWHYVQQCILSLDIKRTYLSVVEFISYGY